MNNIPTLALSACLLGAVALSSCGTRHHEPAPPPQRAAAPRQREAQPSGNRADVRADPALAKRGAALFTSKGCNACHTVGKNGKMAGPDLAGVTRRRTHDWLRRWLKDPNAMFGSDPIVDAMVVEAKNVKMPNMKLSDSEIEALISYFDQNP
jgi:mono/diheme cytochrome c family protein